jgi:branched-chain amino acid transport system permease protein
MKNITFKDVLPRRYHLYVGLGAVALFALVGCVGNDSLQTIMSRVVIMSLYALSLNLQFGYGGMFNIGTSLYLGLGAYGLLICIAKLGLPLGISVLITLVGVIIFALIFGFLSLTKGMITFTFLGMAVTVMISIFVLKSPWLGSDLGLMGHVAPSWLSGKLPLYLFILGVSAICATVLYLLTRSPLIAVLKGSRENDERLTFLGVNVKRLRLTVFVISSTFMGIAGILYAMLNNIASTSYIDIMVSLQSVLMCMIGGVSIFMGPVIGGVIVTLIMSYISYFTIYYQFVLGAVVLLSVYLMPNGILYSKSLWGKGLLKLFIIMKGKAFREKLASAEEEKNGQQNNS